jgi:hypothetical protein
VLSRRVSCYDERVKNPFSLTKDITSADRACVTVNSHTYLQAQIFLT